MAKTENAADNAGGKRIPTVSRVEGDTLIELVYDVSLRQTAFAISRFGGLWNVEQEVKIATGEILVPYAASNNLIANECVLLPSQPIEYGIKQDLISDIRAFLHRYVDLTPLFEAIAAHYVLLSWVHDAFGELPYLRLQGEFGTGKTRGLMTIGSLCYRPFFGSGASSTSAIFRTLDSFGGTLVLDEADLPYSDARADLVKIFNNGTVRGMPVLRTVVNRHKEFNPAAFKVFGPKIIAMRGGFQDLALESRFLTEQTGLRSLRGDIPIHLPAAFKTEALALRNRLLHFRLCEFFNIKTDPSLAVNGVEPRLNQSALPLLSIIDDAALRQQVRQMLVSQSEAMKAARKSEPEAYVLAALDAAFLQSDRANVPLSDIARQFNAVHAHDFGHPVSPKWIGHMLRTRLHICTQKSRGIYVVAASERPKLAALLQRYGVGNNPG